MYQARLLDMRVKRTIQASSALPVYVGIVNNS
jgi:hypothetical protein